MQTNDKAIEFKKLHSSNDPLVLINVWDSASAAVIQQSGAKALATSSASLAWANGYPDGSKIPEATLLHAIKNIIRVCKVPLTVDIEDGYSDTPKDVASFVAKLVKLGVAGINIEDGRRSPELLASKISGIRNLFDTDTLFINARTDVYLQELVSPNNMMNETLVRSEAYIASGADGVFVPGAVMATDIVTMSASIQAPLNVMIPNDCAILREMLGTGASRISLGPAPFIDAYSKLTEIAASLQKTENGNKLSYDSLNELF